MEELIKELLTWHYNIKYCPPMFNGNEITDEQQQIEYLMNLKAKFHSITATHQAQIKEMNKNTVEKLIDQVKENYEILYDQAETRRLIAGDCGPEGDGEIYDWLTYSGMQFFEKIRDAHIDLLNDLSRQITNQDTCAIENESDDWLTYDEVIKKYSFKGKTCIKDRRWRERHNFYPCKQDAKGSAIRISRILLEKWLRDEPE